MKKLPVWLKFVLICLLCVGIIALLTLLIKQIVSPT